MDVKFDLMTGVFYQVHEKVDMLIISVDKNNN